MIMSPSTRQYSTNSSHFREVLARHRSFWERSPQGSFLRSTQVFAPSVPVALPQPNGSKITHIERLTPNMVDVSALIDEVEQWDPGRLDSSMAAQGEYLVSAGMGDLMPLARPLVKLPWLEAMLGCPIKMTEGQIWNEHYAGDLEPLLSHGVNLEHNAWYQLYLEFLRKLQDRLSTRFAVSANTLMRGTSDLVAALMGVQEACVGWLDDPKTMARVLRLVTDTLLTVIEGGQKVMKPFMDGYMAGWAVWAPGQVVLTQADHSSLLSPRTYEQNILPYDIEVLRSAPAAMMHIHNNGLHVAPILVQIPELDVIEVAVDPYPFGERKEYELRMIQMILQHKPLVLDLSAPSWEESEWVLDQLPRRGLCFNAKFDPAVFETLPPEAPGREAWVLQ
jgi:hypothetical protein